MLSTSMLFAVHVVLFCFFNGWDWPTGKAQFAFCELLDPETWAAGQRDVNFFLGGNWTLGKTGFQNAKQKGRKVKRERNLQGNRLLGRPGSRNRSCRDSGKGLPREPGGNVLGFVQCRKQLYCWMESHLKSNPSICEDAVDRGNLFPTVLHFCFLTVRLLYFKMFKF